ncbi:MAG TPA: hypothetical protein VFD31_12525 [Thermoleophilaceae bacterium]|nr:hypothetical protein [Thermoleophilaceae bacterium]
MASKYPRLGVARDPELDQALTQTRTLLDDQETRSQAAHVRALALRGAKSLLDAHDDPAEAYRRKLRKKYNLIPATADPRTLPMPEGEIDPDDPTPMSDALRWVRGKE